MEVASSGAGDGFAARSRRADALLEFAWAYIFERSSVPEALR